MSLFALIGGGAAVLAAGSAVERVLAGKRAAALQWALDGHRSGTLPPPGVVPQNASHVVDGGRVVRGVDQSREPPHWGLDIAAPEGTPVRALTDGIVIREAPISGYGNTVQIAHFDRPESSHYAHLEQAAVGVGDWVRGGDLIGYVGHTTHGPDGTEPDWVLRRPVPMGDHVHMELHNRVEPALGRRIRRIDPVAWLRRRGIRAGG